MSACGLRGRCPPCRGGHRCGARRCGARHGGVRPADLVFVPTPACWGGRSLRATTALLPQVLVYDEGCKAGLTTKPHRDRRTTADHPVERIASGERLTWAVSPATGIG